MALLQAVSHTENDYYNLPEDVRAELIGGKLIYNQAAPSRQHQTILMELSGTIREYRSKLIFMKIYTLIWKI